MIVVGVDGSDACQAALGFAFEIAAERGAELTIVHVREHPRTIRRPSVWVDPDDAPWQQEGRATGHSRAGRLAGQVPRRACSAPTTGRAIPSRCWRSTPRPPTWSSSAVSAAPSSPRCDSDRCPAGCSTTPSARWRSSTPRRRHRLADGQDRPAQDLRLWGPSAVERTVDLGEFRADIRRNHRQQRGDDDVDPGPDDHTRGHRDR